MCKKYVVRRELLGAKELGWSLYNGKEVIEMTSNEIKNALKKGEEILGLEVGENGLLEFSKDFFTRNIMEHRMVNNFVPMIEADECMANVFYIVMGKTSNGLYDVISTRFERTAFEENKMKALYDIGVISAGIKIENGKVILPEEVKPKLVEKTEATKPEKKEPVKKEVKEDKKTS